ncbi:MAG TPA: hypothetical protein VK171_12040 [Fimbriimonas sp.]|nr:hypothetical protein [Fimbriimonas sp.]
MRRGVIDVGSNSVLLAVCDWVDGTWQPVDGLSSITALGEGMKITGLLRADAIERTVEAIRAQLEYCVERHSCLPVVAATMAVRMAKNREDFVQAGRASGFETIVLEGREEAQLGFECVASDALFGSDQRVSIIDPGGQSTEITIADRSTGKWEILFKQSFPVGTLGLRTTHFPDPIPSRQQLMQACVDIDDIFGFCCLPGQCGKTVVLGAAGSNLVTLKLELTSWQPDRIHGFELEYEVVSKYVAALMPFTDEERAQIPFVEEGREKTIHLGALILERAMFALRAESSIVSIRGWRHALVAHDQYFV